jgi:hypothetical protein
MMNNWLKSSPRQRQGSLGTEGVASGRGSRMPVYHLRCRNVQIVNTAGFGITPPAMVRNLYRALAE